MTVLPFIPSPTPSRMTAPGYDWTLHAEADGQRQAIWLGQDVQACEHILELPMRKYLRAVANELETIEWDASRQRIAEDLACALAGETDWERSARSLTSVTLGSTTRQWP